MCVYALNVFIDIQTSKELIQMDTDKMMTYGTFTMDDEKLCIYTGLFKLQKYKHMKLCQLNLHYFELIVYP